MPSLVRVIISLALLLAACATASAQTAKPVKETGSISGRITIGDKGVAYATVTLDNTEQGMPAAARITTDQDGHYAFTNVATGQYAVIASAPPYVLASGQNVALLGKSIALDEGEVVENVDFSLVRGGVITGRITDAQGKPLIGEKIYLLGADGKMLLGQWSTATQESLSTDDRGIFRIFGLSAGRYLVAVGEADQGRLGRQDARAYFRRTYYPEAAEQAQAKTVDVAEGGEVTGVDIMVGRPLKQYAAAGRVIDEATGKPPARILISSRTVTADYKQPTGMGPSTILDAKGNFRLEGLKPGRYSILLGSGGEIGYADPVPLEITDKDVSNLEIRIKRGATINGVAVLTGADDPQVAAQTAKLQIYGYVAGEQGGVRIIGETGLNPDGSFRLARVMPGKLMISLRPTEAAKNFSILQVERDGVPQAEGVAIMQGDQNVNVKVVISYGSGTVRGQLKIENGELSQGTHIRVTIFVDGKEIALHKTEADARGRFLFEGLASGEYVIMAQALVFSNGNMVQLGSIAREQVRVTSGAESQVILTLDLTPPKRPSQN